MRLTITMTDIDYALLKSEAERLDVRMAQVVREALDHRLKVRAESNGEEPQS